MSDEFSFSEEHHILPDMQYQQNIRYTYMYQSHAARKDLIHPSQTPSDALTKTRIHVRRVIKPESNQSCLQGYISIIYIQSPPVPVPEPMSSALILPSSKTSKQATRKEKEKEKEKRLVPFVRTRAAVAAAAAPLMISIMIMIKPVQGEKRKRKKKTQNTRPKRLALPSLRTPKNREEIVAKGYVIVILHRECNCSRSGELAEFVCLCDVARYIEKVVVKMGKWDRVCFLLWWEDLEVLLKAGWFGMWVVQACVYAIDWYVHMLHSLQSSDQTGDHVEEQGLGVSWRSSSSSSS
jgi:hypothetical protein